MENLTFPRLVYHPKLGDKTDYGYTYKKVNTMQEFETYISRGWFATSTEVKTNIYFNQEEKNQFDPSDEETEETPQAEPVKKAGRPRKAA